MSFLNVTFLDLFDFNRKSKLWKYIVKSCSKHFDPDKIWEYGFPYHKNLVHVIKDELLLELGVSTTRRVPFYMFYKAHAIMGRSSYFPRNNSQSGQDTMQLSTLWNFCCFLCISEYLFMIFDGIWKLNKGHYFMFCLKFLNKETFSLGNLFTIVNSCYLGYTIFLMLLRWSDRTALGILNINVQIVGYVEQIFVTLGGFFSLSQTFPSAQKFFLFFLFLRYQELTVYDETKKIIPSTFLLIIKCSFTWYQKWIKREGAET